MPLGECPRPNPRRQPRGEREPKSPSGAGKLSHVKPESASTARQFPRETATKGESRRCQRQEKEFRRFSTHKRSSLLQPRCCQRDRSRMEETPSRSAPIFNVKTWYGLPGSLR